MVSITKWPSGIPERTIAPWSWPGARPRPCHWVGRWGCLGHVAESAGGGGVSRGRVGTWQKLATEMQPIPVGLGPNHEVEFLISCISSGILTFL